MHCTRVVYSDVLYDNVKSRTIKLSKKNLVDVSSAQVSFCLFII